MALLLGKEKWHALQSKEVLEVLDATDSGLSKSEAEKRFSLFGPNDLPKKKERVILRILFNQFNNPFAYILAIAGFISLVLGSFIDAIVVFAALFLNAGIGFFQEWKASNIFEHLRKFVTYRAVVRRDGVIANIDAKEIVPGDIIIIKQGERVAADARLIKASNFRTDETILTGESMPVEKKIETVAETAVLADRKNMVFLGTAAAEGAAEAVVIATGDRTEFGKITAMVLGLEQEATPLQIKMKRLAIVLGAVFVFVAALLLIVGVVVGRDLFEMFLTAVAVAVAAVPESLPIALTIALAVGARQIYKSGGLVKKILAAEGLGSTEIVLVDKTATLTEGKMALSQIITADGKEIESKDFKPEDTVLRMLVLTADATIENKEAPKESWKIHGRPIDRAILESLSKINLDKETVSLDHPRQDEIIFDAKYKYSAVLNKLNEKENTAVVLGAPEIIFSMSREVSPAIIEKVTSLAGEGLRVLALALKNTNEDHFSREKLKDLSFTGLIVFTDPIRQGVEEAVSLAKKAGVRPVIVTGDHILTANFVGRQLGILTKPERAIEEADLPLDLSEAVENYDVFARVTPRTKLKLVQAFQAKNYKVAMIGDGVNDAPALVAANIGVALGSGTDVAKQAADLILVRDSFAVIVEAIKQGRIILDNIKKAATFLLSSSFAEIILIGGSILLGLPLALLPAQILWVNIIQDGLPAIALAFEKEENNVMAHRPEKQADIFTKKMKQFIGAFVVVTNLTLFLLFYLFIKNTGNVDYARTMVFVTLGLTSLTYVFSIKAFSRPVWKIKPFDNTFLNWSVLIGFGLYFVAIYLPPFNQIFSATALGFVDWLILSGICLFNVSMIELGKWFFWQRNAPALTFLSEKTTITPNE